LACSPSSSEDVAGVVGLALCALAVYGTLAMALEDAQGRTVLPLLRHGAGRASIDGPRDGRVAGLEREAGVREQL
jgi:uncharacterized protein